MEFSDKNIKTKQLKTYYIFYVNSSEVLHQLCAHKLEVCQIDTKHDFNLLKNYQIYKQ